ncbi:MAG: hypothetical protein JXR63_12290 [Spirochaetales bacterium]|nr:hypothetical protein [Spirochaetales bacterium]
MKKIGILVFLIFILVGCSIDSKEVIGSWKATSGEEEGSAIVQILRLEAGEAGNTFYWSKTSAGQLIFERTGTWAVSSDSDGKLVTNFIVLKFLDENEVSKTETIGVALISNRILRVADSAGRLDYYLEQDDDSSEE